MSYLFVIFALMILNALSTRYLLKQGIMFSDRQKRNQLFVIWLVPFFGALVVCLFLKSQLEKVDWKPDSTEVIAARDLESKSIVYGMSASRHHSGSDHR